MKTFEDLVFEPHAISVRSNRFKKHKQAIIDFDNGYSVSVIFGTTFYSNGIDTYELAVFLEGEICYPSEIGDDVLAYITKEEVTEAMIKVQQLK